MSILGPAPPAACTRIPDNLTELLNNFERACVRHPCALQLLYQQIVFLLNLDGLLAIPSSPSAPWRRPAEKELRSPSYSAGASVDLRYCDSTNPSSNFYTPTCSNLCLYRTPTRNK